MRVWHTTLRQNLPSILKRGILGSYSKGKMPVVWVHDHAQQSWAFLHVVRRHGGRVEDVVSLCVDVSDDTIRRSAAPGLYYTTEDVPPIAIVDVVKFQTVSASPLEIREHAVGKPEDVHVPAPDRRPGRRARQRGKRARRDAQ